MPKRRCKSRTKAGKRCKAPPLRDGERCLAHARKPGNTRGFGGPQPGAGRPRLPKPHERMRELIEQRLEELVAPYFEAVRTAVVIAKHEGEVHTSEVPDLGARIAAAERLLDRVYGRPAQGIELGGSETAPPITAIVAGDAREVSDAARAFLRSLLPADAS